MAASDHLEPRLFHGSNAWLKPGTVLQPGNRDAFYGEPVGVYASTDMEIAAHFSNGGNRNQEKQSLSSGIPYQPSLFSPVYEVEHVSEHSDPEGRLAEYQSSSSYRRDLQGFRIKRVAGFSGRNGEVL
jgi:hypothetical protein